MKKLTIIFSFIFLINACQESTNSSTTNTSSGIFQTISKDDFGKKLKKHQANLILIDVRTPAEFQNGTIENAVNINFNDANFVEKISDLDKSQPIYIFCQKGGRSRKALNKMKELEFQEVYELKGGYGGWID